MVVGILSVVSSWAPNEWWRHWYSRQIDCDCKRRLVGRGAFVGPPTWQSLRRDGLLKLNVSNVLDDGGVKAGWFTRLAEWLLMCGVLWSTV